MGKTKYKLLSIEEKLAVYDEYTATGYGGKAEKLEELSTRFGVPVHTMTRWIGKTKLTLLDKPHEDEYLFVKGTSTLDHAEKGEMLKWTKRDTDNEKRFEAIKKSVVRLMDGLTPAPATEAPHITDNRLCNVYISNDVHIGALMWEKETGDRDWNTRLAIQTLRSAIDFTVDNSPSADMAIIADLGDLTEMDDFKNATPHSGHTLDVDGRYSAVVGAAMESMVYMVEKALTKHTFVTFINISGNHDITTGHAIRAFVRAWFKDDSRVLVDDSPTDIKYYKHGTTMLGFAHGDGLKMQNAGEVMALDCKEDFSSSENRYFHFGHTHKDAVHDGRLCRSESHRNLAPLNHWAAHKGFRSGAGTMKCITYDTRFGELNRTTYNVMMENEDD